MESFVIEIGAPYNRIIIQIDQCDKEEPPVSIERQPSPLPHIQENYDVSCNSHRISTIVTCKPFVVREWVRRMRHRHRYQLRKSRLIVGLGVQWVPGRSAPATLQLCVGHECLVFQLMHAHQSPKVVHRLLSDPGVILVGIWNSRDAVLLRKSRHRLRIRRQLVDVRRVANDMRDCGRMISMGRLAKEVLDFVAVEKDDEVGKSAWDKRWLSEDQVEYACVDVFVCFMIAKELKVWKWIGLRR